MKINVYKKIANGLVEFQGSQNWESESQLRERFGAEDKEPQREHLAGWPNSLVDWYGNLGIGRDEERG